MHLLKGKKALVLGVANERSIAWGIAKKLKSQGAAVALTYLNDALKKRVEPLAQGNWEPILFARWTWAKTNTSVQPAKRRWPRNGANSIYLIHSLAFADRSDLSARFSHTSRQGFLLTLDISAYSLIGLCQHLQDLMSEEGSVIAMTYDGARRVVKNYNLMGVAKAALETSMMYLAEELGSRKIRVNCISAGPIKTLAASGIGGFRSILQTVEEQAPLKRNITPDDVAGMALYLASDLSQNVTGQILHVDSGLSAMGISSP